MKTLAVSLITAAALCGVSALTVSAQRADGPPDGPRHPPASPLIVALDLDRDGVLSANEIAQASKSLATLDKNSDGQITREEFRPRRDRRGGSDEVRQRGPQGDKKDKKDKSDRQKERGSNGPDQQRSRQ